MHKGDYEDVVEWANKTHSAWLEFLKDCLNGGGHFFPVKVKNLILDFSFSDMNLNEFNYFSKVSEKRFCNGSTHLVLKSETQQKNRVPPPPRQTRRIIFLYFIKGLVLVRLILKLS